MVTVFRKVIQFLTQNDLENMSNVTMLVRRNDKLLRCPCCGSLLTVDAMYMRDDPRYNTKVIERAMSCKACRIRIRQYVYLW